MREKGDKICMHRSVPEYKQRIIMGHKVTVWCYVAWGKWVLQRVGGMKVGLTWLEQDGTLFPLAVTLASSAQSLFCWRLRYTTPRCSRPFALVTSFSLSVGVCVLQHNTTQHVLLCSIITPFNPFCPQWAAYMYWRHAAEFFSQSW
jgi:hypothetical protein